LGIETAALENAMHITLSNVLALMFRPDFGFLKIDFTGNGFVWSMIGAILAVVGISALGIDAALVLNAPPRLQPRVRWPEVASETRATMSPSYASPDGSSSPT